MRHHSAVSGLMERLSASGALAVALAATFCPVSLHAQDAGRKALPGYIPTAVTKFHLAAIGRLPGTNRLSLALGLPLRNQTALDELLQQLYDPRSTNFHKFLTSEEFTARFGPTKAEYQAVIQFAERNGLTIVGTSPNRVVLDVEGSVSNIERAFQITLRSYHHPTAPRDFFAPDAEPSVPANLPMADLWGLSDYALPTPLSRPVGRTKASPLNYNGTGPGGSYQGRDFRNAYAPGVSLAGSGQIVAVAEFDGYYTNDIATYEARCGYTNVPLTNILLNVTGIPGYSGQGVNAIAEVSLDIELQIAMAPGLTGVMVYEGSNPYTVLNQIATDNRAKQISCSWTWSVGPTYNWGSRRNPKTLDSVLQQMAAQGQSFFQASGDSDAYTGSQSVNSSTGPIPVDSIYATSVGGTSLTMTSGGGSWVSETTWNWGNNTGSGGGVSSNYTIPFWQTNVNTTANGGSTTYRNFPDVALTADAVEVVYNNGASGVFGGTSCAAPLWAGFTALVNQQATASGGGPVGFLNPALYRIAATTNYPACFHDITTGNNIGTNTPGLYYAGNNYDLTTGLGTPNGINLINALAPPALPYFITQPISQTATNGDNVTFNVAAGGQSPLNYRWRFNGTNLFDGGNVSGAASNTLTLTTVTPADTGSYSVVVTNSYGAVTSTVATLTVVFPPSFVTQPTNQTVVAGNDAVFSATVSGATPLMLQWQKSGTNLVNGGNISGATSNALTLAAVSAGDAGDYTLVATNIYGAATSSVTTLTVLLPPTITVPLTNQTIQCGSGAVFNVGATGTAPLNYQWSVDGNMVPQSPTSASLTLTNVHLPNHLIAVIVTNLYGSATSAATLVVQDTLPPAITLIGANPFYVELGGAYVEPGATAEDACAGTVPVSISGAVNTNAVGTNTVVYTADDGNGNTNTVTRAVIVHDTTPPTILWSFTNLALAADTNCSAVMPDVTGTNFIQATDLSEPLTIEQSPTNGTFLPLGTNVVLLAVSDAYGNTAFSTNTIIVQDQTPPVIFAQPENQTNTVGATASFAVGATACTPLAFQWFFNDAPLAAETNDTLTLSNVSLAAAGSYFAVVSADGGSTTSSVVTLTVNLVVPALAVVSSENPSGFNDGVAFTASLTPTNATGTIQFFTNDVAFDLQPLVAGTAVSTNVSTLPRGTNFITAVYSGDANDLPATNTLAQIVTNHPPVAADAFYSRLAGYPLNIAVADLATNWSDADGDTVSLAAIGVSTNGVTLTNDNGTLVYFDTNNVDDEFVCTITDGWGGAGFQTVHVAIVTNATPAIAVAPGNTTNGITLSLVGASGYTYVLEATTNLLPPTDWLPLATNTLDTNGVWQFTDAEATNFPQRFYRLKLSP